MPPLLSLALPLVVAAVVVAVAAPDGARAVPVPLGPSLTTREPLAEEEDAGGTVADGITAALSRSSVGADGVGEAGRGAGRRRARRGWAQGEGGGWGWWGSVSRSDHGSGLTAGGKDGVGVHRNEDAIAALLRPLT